MQNYLHQFQSDLEARILNRWRTNPPHFYQMGLPDQWLEPPAGYKGPPLGFRMTDDEQAENDFLSQLETEKMLAEVDQYVSENPRETMYDHFDLASEQFPPVDKLTDAQLEALVPVIFRLWAAFNFGAAKPSNVPLRVLYPILLERMAQPSMVFERGHCGIELCSYDPSECPFGLEYCGCKH